MPEAKDMATFLEGAWNVSVVDVEATLRHICKKATAAPYNPSQRHPITPASRTL